MSGTVDFVQEILGTPANDLARRVGELTLKGISRPVPAFSLTGLGG